MKNTKCFPESSTVIVRGKLKCKVKPLLPIVIPHFIIEQLRWTENNNYCERQTSANVNLFWLTKLDCV